jgi:Gluconate 2-dehydrogenase subunit 3
VSEFDRDSPPFEPTETIDGLTRRQWVLILGRLAAVAGFSGIVPELPAALAAAGEQQLTALPPGLYYPAEEHLAHALGDIGSVHEIPPGCETDYVRPVSGPFRPQFFSQEELEVVTRIIHIVLGEVDSGTLSQVVNWLDLYLHSATGVREAAQTLDPLHRALAIAYQGDSALRELENADPQSVFGSGLAALQQLSVEQYARGFCALDHAQQANLVATISRATPDSSLRKFFEILRTEAIRAYYTSRAGLKDLDYKGNWYYAVCPGCERK